jgi:hypothetical protein
MVEGEYISNTVAAFASRQHWWVTALELECFGSVSNPSFERTCQSWLRQLRPAAQLQR